MADHQARIVSVDGNRVRLEIDLQPTSRLRRLTDRPVTLGIDVRFEEECVQKARDGGSARRWTPARRGRRSRIAIGPLNGRDRRRDEVDRPAREVLMSFRSYLMAYEDESGPPAGAMARLKRILTPWRIVEGLSWPTPL